MWEEARLIAGLGMDRPHKLLALVFGAIFFGPATLLAQPVGVTGYEAVWLEALGGTELDDFGRVLGSTAGDPYAHSAVWVNGKIIALEIPNGYQKTYENAISPTTGIVVGSTYNPWQPIAWTARSIFLLSNLGSADCSAHGVNDSGWVVGYCNGTNRAPLWIKGGDPIDLGDLGGGRSGAVDINGKNEIVGSSYPTRISSYVPFLWRDGEMIDIFAEAGFEWTGYASSINNHSEIVGEGGPLRGAFHWHEGVATLLPEPGPCGASFDAQAINDQGLIVGRGADPDCGPKIRAAVWDRKLGFEPFTIDRFLVHPEGIKLFGANDINNAGQIGCYGEDVNGDRRSYLVTPYRFELGDPVPGVAGEMNVITVTGLDEGQRVKLFFGTKVGAQPIGNGCLGGLVLIRDAKTHKSLEAFGDADGVAEFRVLVPGGVSGKTVRYQVVGPDECEISHTVEFLFE